MEPQKITYNYMHQQLTPLVANVQSKEPLIKKISLLLDRIIDEMNFEEIKLLRGTAQTSMELQKTANEKEVGLTILAMLNQSVKTKPEFDTLKLATDYIKKDQFVEALAILRRCNEECQAEDLVEL